MRLCSGTETQDLDPDIAASGVAHPAYRGLCYAVFLDSFLGANRAAVPNIELVVSRYPSPAWLTTRPNIQEDCQPLAVLADLWTHPRCGLGLPAPRLDTVGLSATAAQLVAEGVGVSGVILQAARFTSVGAQLLEHFDGYLTVNAAGQLGVGLIRGPSGAEPTLDQSDLLEDPVIQLTAWPDTFNQTIVKFSSRDKAWQANSVTWNGGGNFAVTGATKGRQIERPWVTRQDLAWQIAAAHCKQAALPRLSGSLRARWSSVSTFAPGTLFNLTFASSGISGLLCRVESLTMPAAGSAEVSLTWIEDRGYLNGADYVVPADDPVTPAKHEPAALAGLLTSEMPWGWEQTERPRVLMLPARGDRLCNGFSVWFEVAENSFTLLATGTLFCVRGVLVNNLPASGPLVADEAGIEVVLESPDKTLADTPLADAAERHSLLFIGDEICWCWEPVLVDAGRYRLKVARARYGSARGDYAAGQDLFIAFPTPQQGIAVHRFDGNHHDLAVTWKAQPKLLHLS